MISREHLSRLRSAGQVILIAVCLVLGVLSAVLLYRYFSVKNEIFLTAQEKAISLNKQATKNIDKYLSDLANSVNDLAQKLSSHHFSPQNILEPIHHESTLHGLGVAFAPYAYDKTKKLYAPYNVNIHGKNNVLYLEKIYDYTQTDSPRSIQSSFAQGGFHDPFIDPASKTIVIEYSKPFYDKNNIPIGVVFGNYSLQDMQQFIANQYPSQWGHGSIIAQSGIFISFPITEFVSKKKTVPQFARDAHHLKNAQDLQNGIDGVVHSFVEEEDWLTARKSWVVFDSLTVAPWKVTGVFAQAELQGDPVPLNKRLVVAIMVLILFLIMLACLLIAFFSSFEYSFWLYSLIISYGFICGISFIWYQAYKKIPYYESSQILDKNFLNTQKMIANIGSKSYRIFQPNFSVNSTHPGQSTMEIIPTGIYIRQLVIQSNQIQIIGYVWQRIPLNKAAVIKPGIIFPQATDITMEQEYTFQTDQWKTIGWSMRCTLKQNFDYSNYPFDFKHIKISLWPTTFDNSQLLIPDVDGYVVISPVGLPGFNKEINQQIWHYYLTYFTYQENNFLTNFGYHASDSFKLNEYEENISLPALNFDIVANRNAGSNLILNLLPIIIILVLLFILLVMAPFMEFTTVFGFLSSFFFTALVAYTAFKSYLDTQQVVFFDYLYFTIQSIILIICAISMAYYSKKSFKLIKYKNMLIPQLLFWPLITGTILIISLIFFS